MKRRQRKFEPPQVKDEGRVAVIRQAVRARMSMDPAWQDAEADVREAIVRRAVALWPADATEAAEPDCHNLVELAIEPREPTVREIQGWKPYFNRLDEREQLNLEKLLDQPAGRVVSDLASRMLDDARRATLATGQLISEKTIYARFGIDLRRKLQMWREAGAIFSVAEEGTALYPLYGFDRDNAWQPYPTMTNILALFRPRQAWSIAIWFASANSFLEGARPQDLLSSQPELVRRAAEGEMVGPAHG